jgi:hypothetical protein
VHFDGGGGGGGVCVCILASTQYYESIKKMHISVKFYYVTPVNCVKSTDVPLLLFYDFTCGNFFLMFYLIFCVLAVIICKNMAIIKKI